MPPQDSTFTLLLFASASTYTGHTSLDLPAPTPFVHLFAVLEARFPGIRAKVLEACAVSVNLEYVEFEARDMVESVPGEGGSGNGVEGEGEGVRSLVIGPGDEVGIIPPVSSG